MIKLNTFLGNHLKIDSECDIFEFSLTWSALQKKYKSTFNEDMQRNDCVRASLALFLDCKFTQCISVGGNNVPGETGEGRKKSVCGSHRGVFSAFCHLTAALFTQTKWKPTSCLVIYAQYFKIIFKNNRLDIEYNLKCFFFLWWWWFESADLVDVYSHLLSGRGSQTITILNPPSCTLLL